MCDGRDALLGDADEMVAPGRGLDCVDGDLDAAIGAVLEADGERNARGKLAVELRFRRAGADGAEADQVVEVLGGDGVEHFGDDGKTNLGDVDKELAGGAEAFVDVEGVVEVGIVDQALPSHAGSRFLEVRAHDDAELAGKPMAQGLESASILECDFGIVDRARPDGYEQTV